MTKTTIQTKSKKIPTYPRFDLIKKQATKVIIRHASNKVPISLSDIVDRFDDITLRSYSWYQREMNVSLDYIIDKLVKSKDGGLLEISDDTENKEFMILYNSDKMLGRKRFTIAHELGHYFLEHHSLIVETVICRGEITKDEYEILEKEANYFARLLLVPLPLIPYLERNWGTINKQQLMHIFSVGFIVSGYVFTHIYNQRKRGYIPSDTNIINKYKNSLNRYINIHCCNTCYDEFVHENPQHCPICGSRDIDRIMSDKYMIHKEFGGDYYMFYEGIEVNENSKAVICPICGNEEPSAGKHCLICGTYLANHCTNIDSPDRSAYDNAICGVLLPGNARYCTHCGAESTYLQNKLLEPWDKTKNDNQNPQFLSIEEAAVYRVDDGEDDLPF